MKLIENEEIRAYTSITNIFEIRFVLRRKKKFPEENIKKFVSNLYGEINIEIPDYVDMLTANKFQSNYAFDPFDSISLGMVQTLPETSMVSRDADFLKLAIECGIRAYTPEEYMEKYFQKVFEQFKADMY